MILLFCDFKSFAYSVALLDQFFLFVDKGVSIRKSVKFSSWICLLTDGFILQIWIFLEEIVDKFCIEVFVSVDFDLSCAVLDGVRILGVHEIGIFIKLWRNDTVLHEVLHAWF
jgi:hypothetical protein